MTKFTQLHVTADDAAMWHLYDNEVKKVTHKDWALVLLVMLSTLIYVPMAVGSVIILKMSGDTVWIMVLTLDAIGLFWHLHAWNMERCNVCLAKHLKSPESGKRLMEMLAGNYGPMRMFLYNKKYQFAGAYLDYGVLTAEFDDGGTPHGVRVVEYEVCYTEDERMQGIMTLDENGLTLFMAKENAYHVSTCCKGGAA